MPNKHLGIRLDSELRDAFDEYCNDHFTDPRAVVEALILDFLEADQQRRRELAAKYQRYRQRKRAAQSPDK